MEIYLVCRENRKKLGLTVDEFSRFIGINVKDYEKFEEGEYVFSKDIMKIVLSSLYVDKEDFEKIEYDDEILNISMNAINECEKGE